MHVQTIARKQLTAIAVAVLLALGVTAIAAAWSHEYVVNATFWANDSGHSGYNYNLDGNALNFTNAWGGSPTLGSRYIDAGGGGINAYDWRGASFIDWRTVSYGAAQCTANGGNGYPLYIYQCYTDN
ncbi:MAG TPA: hypothetical protein VIZ32_24440 [Vicinamibacterales bacterium]|jgi:hypothetical protein